MKNKRVAIFASYDKSGIVYDYVISYIKKLSYHCDKIIFICDNYSSREEQEKLDKYVDYYSFERHGEYDFGSYKRGFNYIRNQSWFENIEEIIFCNDSCFTCGNFDYVFSKMDSIDCDFWGMTFNNYGTHVQSFFWALRKEVFSSEFFINWINSITRKEKFIDIVLSYEIPFTNLLKYHGYKIAYFIYPYDLPHQHPLFTLSHGDPLVKRKCFMPAKYNLWDICLDNFYLLIRYLEKNYNEDYNEIKSYYSKNTFSLLLRVYLSTVFWKFIRKIIKIQEYKNINTYKFFGIPIYRKKWR